MADFSHLQHAMEVARTESNRRNSQDGPAKKKKKKSVSGVNGSTNPKNGQSSPKKSKQICIACMLPCMHHVIFYIRCKINLAGNRKKIVNGTNGSTKPKSKPKNGSQLSPDKTYRADMVVDK